MGVDVRPVRRDRVRRGQHGPAAVRGGQRRAGHDAPAPGRGRPAGRADTVRGQQDGRAGFVRRGRRGRRAPAARATGTGPAVAVGQHRRSGRVRGRRTSRSVGMADRTGQSVPSAIARRRSGHHLLTTSPSRSGCISVSFHFSCKGRAVKKNKRNEV